MDENIPNPLPPNSQPAIARRRGPWDWLKDEPNFPSAKRPTKKRRSPIFLQFLGRWLRPRLFLSTWLFHFHASAALAILEIPGRRTGFTTYAHGWPFAYMDRDYRQDSQFLDWEGWTMHGWSAGFGGQHWVGAERETAFPYQEVFARDGFPIGYEQKMSPWSAIAATSFSDFALAADVLLTILSLIAIGWAAQRWRRRRIAAGRRRMFQFRLRTFLLAAMIVGPTLGLIFPWFLDYRRDRLAVQEIQDNGNLGVTQMVSHWRPPAGLPESLLKLGPVERWSERLDTLSIDSRFGAQPPPSPPNAVVNRSVPGVHRLHAFRLPTLLPT